MKSKDNATLIKDSFFKRHLFITASLSLITLQFFGIIAIHMGTGFTRGVFNTNELSYRPIFYYLAFISLTLISYFLFYQAFRYISLATKPREPIYTKTRNRYYLPFMALQLIALTLILIIFYFLGGGSEIITGELEKGTLRRADLGLGPLRPLLFDWAPKYLLLFSALHFCLTNKSRKLSKTRSIFFTTLLITVLIAIMTGFRGSFFFFIAPALSIVILFSRSPAKKSLTPFFILIFLLLFISFYLNSKNSPTESIISLAYRIFITPSLGPHYILTNFSINGNAAEYLPTLTYFLGGTVVSFLYGSGFNAIHDVNFTWKITHILGYSPEQIAQQGHTSTVSIVGESFYALGLFGLLPFPILLSFLVASTQRLLQKSLTSQHWFFAATLCLIFWQGIISWINGGGITKILNLNDIIFIIFMWSAYGFFGAVLTHKTTE